MPRRKSGKKAARRVQPSRTRAAASTSVTHGSVADDAYESEQLVLSDLINRVLDKGVVISANIMLSIADIDLVQLDLKLLLSSVATLTKRAEKRTEKRAHLLVRPRSRA